MDRTYELAPFRTVTRLDEYVFEIDREAEPSLASPIRLVADPAWLVEGGALRALRPLVNVSSLPYNLHERPGEGCPGGVTVASHSPRGIVVPSCVGPDVNCGLRLLTTPIRLPDARPHLRRLLEALAFEIPIGTERGSPLSLSAHHLDQMLEEGARHLVRRLGIGTYDDLANVESNGHLHDAHGEHLSSRAKSLGQSQLGTLGTGGSHFVEVGVVDEVLDAELARRLGLVEQRLTVLIHASARGLGHCAYQDALESARQWMELNGARPSRESLAYAALDSGEGLACYHGLRAAANYGFANRHALTHLVRSAFDAVFAAGSEVLVACDVATNVVQLERHGGDILCVHRRGTSAAFGPGGHHLVPGAFRDVGMPLLLAGTMGSASYACFAGESARAQTFASVCHGTGRRVSRRDAARRYDGRLVQEELESRGVLVHCPTRGQLAEEAPAAYHDVDRVAEVLERSGLARKIARLRPVAVLKG